MKKIILSTILATNLFSMDFMTESKLNSVVIQIARANVEPKTNQPAKTEVKTLKGIHDEYR